jgi:hypothetical protein
LPLAASPGNAAGPIKFAAQDGVEPDAGNEATAVQIKVWSVALTVGTPAPAQVKVQANGKPTVK